MVQRDSKRRDWATELDIPGATYLRKEGEHHLCQFEGFIFKVHRATWPPRKLFPARCLQPTEYFKFLVIKCHGNIYDLTETVFTGADNSVRACCPTHGPFSIRAAAFISDRGCPMCGDERIGVLSRKSTSKFIEEARALHGDKFIYDKTEYSTVFGKVVIDCKIHGEFSILPSGHMKRHGCPQCSRAATSRSRKLDQDTVIERFRLRHSNRYDYSGVVYNGNAHAGLKIGCREHGPFIQSYANHNSGEGCPVCSREQSPRFREGFISIANRKNYASLYLIRCYGNNEEFYKIGITTKTVASRFAGQSSLPYSYELIHLHTSDGAAIWDLENILHRIYKESKYLPGLEFGGRFECFKDIDIAEYVKLLNCIA